jgi:hypothetical protein
VRTRNIIPSVKHQKGSKYDYLVGTTIGTRIVLASLPRSLFEVKCLKCEHLSVQRGIDLQKLSYRECKKCQIDNRDPNLNIAYLRTKGNAKTRNISFKISKNYFSKIASQPCFYCNSKPAQETKSFVDRCKPYNGLDRIDPYLGYIEGNVASCCKYCNYAKHDMSVQDFKEWLTKCYTHTIIDKDNK